MQRKTGLRLLSFLFFLYHSASLGSDATLLNACSVFEENDQVSITLKFDQPIDYHCLLLEKPDRFVIDLSHAALNTPLPSMDNTFIKAIRSSDHDHAYLRLVFDLKQKIKHASFYTDEKKKITIQLTQPGLTSSPKAYVTKKKSVKHIVIVIDPGHGGKDPGAKGAQGTLEKDVVLKISKQLRAMLNKETGFYAVLTRSTDAYISLRKRLSIARKNRADMFIAIHADAYHHSHAIGASVYALSQRGATSEAARFLAEKENESELGGLGDVLADKDAILRSVLIDLSQTHTIESSLRMGHKILGNLAKLGRLHHLGVEQAAFVVLKSPDIPSVLVETGFLSNPNEEKKLIDSTFQHQMAHAIKEGIRQYFTPKDR
jgi:N-acetylmuramoyl-L-alanine amidase